MMASRPTRQHVSTREPSYRKCVSEKVGYATKAEAIEAAELQMLEDKVKPGCHITPYFCRDCQEWHVGNRVIVPLKWQR